MAQGGDPNQYRFAYSTPQNSFENSDDMQLCTSLFQPFSQTNQANLNQPPTYQPPFERVQIQQPLISLNENVNLPPASRVSTQMFPSSQALSTSNSQHSALFSTALPVSRTSDLASYFSSTTSQNQPIISTQSTITNPFSSSTSSSVFSASHATYTTPLSSATVQSNNHSHSHVSNHAYAQPNFSHPISHSNLSFVNPTLIKLPDFDKDNIEAWFLSVEYCFLAMNVGRDQDKFASLMSKVEPRTLQGLSATLGELPPLGRYEYVKAKLINFCTESQQKRLNRIISEMPLGDLRPSQLYAEMTRLAGGTMMEEAIKNFWIKRLPIYAQAAVAASAGPASEYVKIADAIVDALSSQVNELSTNTNVFPSSSAPLKASQPANDVCTAINELSKRLDKMWSDNDRGRQQTRGRSSSRGRSNNRRNSRSRTPASHDICYYHRKFGEKSRNCRSPCNFKSKANDNKTKQE